MTSGTTPGRADVSEEQRQAAEVWVLAGPHESWCQVINHGDCCARDASDCDCGVWQRGNAIAVALADEYARGVARGQADSDTLRARVEALAAELAQEALAKWDDNFLGEARRLAAASNRLRALLEQP